MTTAAAEFLPPRERLGDDHGRHAVGAAAIPYSELLDSWTGSQAASAWPLRRTCSTRYRAIRTSGRRSPSSIDLLVVHCTEGVTAEGAARWFTNPECRGSAHVVVDGLACYRTLPPSAIPWGAPGTNGRGWHLEIAGRAKWTRGEWLKHMTTLERAAFKLAWHGRAFSVPIRRLTDAELRGGRKRGIVDHRQASRVYGGTHWDVGDGFPWDVFLKLARGFVEEL